MERHEADPTFKNLQALAAKRRGEKAGRIADAITHVIDASSQEANEHLADAIWAIRTEKDKEVAGRAVLEAIRSALRYEGFDV